MKKRAQMKGHSLRRGGLLRGILEGELGKKRGKLQIGEFPQHSESYGMWDFWKIERAGWDGWDGFASNQS